MFEYLKSYLLFANRFCGVEHTFKGNEGILHVTLLKKTKKEVDIEACFSSKTIKETISKLPKNQHIFLVVNDEHVLTKSLKNEQKDGLNLINKAFPNINISEFYYEIIHQDETHFISICRKEYVDNITKEYREHNIHVISFSLGNSIISNTIPYIGNTSILTSNASISTQDHFIRTIDYTEVDNEEHYSVNGLEVTNAYLLSLSSALSSILSNNSPITNYQDKKLALLNTYKQVRFYSQFLKMGLVFILGMLLVNFLCFNFYFNQVSELNQTSQLNQTTKSNIVKLNETVGKVQKITEDLLQNSASKSSFYVNALVNSLPSSILLSEINYQFLKKNIKPDKAIELNLNTIIVSGESNNSAQYSEWIMLLENMSWIDKVAIETYNDSKTMASNFSIKINITP